MNRWSALLLSALLALTFVAPLSSAQAFQRVTTCKEFCLPNDPDVNPTLVTSEDNKPIKMILYPHFETIVQRAPLNVQLVDVDEGSLNDGFTMLTLNTEIAEPGNVHFHNNNLVWYSSAGPVFVVEGKWTTHQEPGLAEDLTLVGENMWLYLYIAVNPVPNGDDDTGLGPLTSVDAMPAIGVYSRIETGRFSYNSQATLIAEGDTDQEDPIGPGRITGCCISRVAPQDDSQSQIYQVKVPLKITEAGRTIPSIWPKTVGGPEGPPGFTVTTNIYQVKQKENPDDGKTNEFTHWDWRLVTGIKGAAQLTPRLVFDIEDPLVTKKAELNVFENDLFTRWSYMSPFGTVDIDPLSLRIGVTGPTEVSPDLIRLVILKFSTDHNGHFIPVNATWRFNFRQAGLVDGEYTVRVSAQNWQHTYELVEKIPFTVAGGVPKTFSSSTSGGVKDIPIIGGGSGGPGGPANPQGGGDEGGKLPGFEAGILVAAGLVAAFASRRRRA